MSLTIDPLFGFLQVSSLIKIKRSDGRIHLAKIVQLSSESKSVDVEWNQTGEVKGKEILLDLVFELNDELKPISLCQQSTTVVIQQIQSTVPSNDLSLNRLTLDIESLEREYKYRSPPTLPPQLLQRIQQQQPVSVRTISTPLPPPPLLNGYENYSGQKNYPYTPSTFFVSYCFTLQRATYKLLSVGSCSILCLV